jgi:hypothetical protein
LISLTAADEEPPLGEDGAAEVAGAADVGAAAEELAEALGLPLPLLLQAARAMTAPKTNMRKTLGGCNRMGSPPGSSAELKDRNAGTGLVTDSYARLALILTRQ